ncbi:chitobiase/beta-hexosaminidase C-terminal domain-containing protein [uncultured Draconibacterium sp.]|uniref:chitobiase/beta-hexosaminidase C-terminal domain-containing protein n=1 Tax=uncultured Draconibacterium sp. TaxID=1573823 RepID=UPI0025DE3C2F|nr:chitobiase/beta-hexosaminidase C-terminal domain-containing protein [uncultured Draconibacterium sp.]
MLLKIKNTTLLLLLLIFTANRLVAESQKILITEFMAINDKTISDEDGDDSDWLELFNPGDNTVSLNGWYLTDKADNLTKWKIPDINLKAGEYLLIFASEKKRDNPASELHTNFKLSGSGEFLAIVEPDGVTISHSYGESYPAQREDISYGLYQGQYLFFSEPTPGFTNVLGEAVQPPQFSKTRGFYDSPFQVTLSTIGSGIKLYYSTDGTRPDAENGTLYTSPIQISTTTPLSVVAINQAGVASDIISHTYFFINDIVQQPNNPAGYPSTWSKFKYKSGYAPADYEMDQQICNHTDYKNLMDDALLSVPTLSVVTNVGYLFSHEKDGETGGIYIFTGDSGEGGAGSDWERPASVEYYDPASNKQFQLNCGLRLHGGNSRVPDNSGKHSFRLSFRSMYGPSKLQYRFFDDPTATNEFNALVLRAGYNYSWTKNDPKQRQNAQYLQDPFAKDAQRALGQVSAHQKFVHLYLNGLYWGLYNVSEKLTNDFMESYLNGEEDDFDVIKDHGGQVDGYWTSWTHLYNQAKAGLSSNTNYQKVQGKNPDGTINPAFENLLDVENLAGYMQYNMYIGNEDWDHNNWIAARNRVTNDAGFRFFAWDAETSMTSVNANMVNENNEENPSWFYQLLQGNEDFRVLFADQIQKNFLNGGPLSPEACIERYTKLADEIDLAIIAESARWGDYRKDTDPSDGTRVLYTRNEHWLPRKEYLLNNYFPYRTDIVVEQFRNIGLFPNIEAPLFSEQSGEKTTAINLGMTTNYGDIYYTTDGSDPREQITSNITASAQLFGSAIYLADDVTVKARAKSGNEWSPLTEGTFTFDNVTAIDDVVQNNLFHDNYPNPFNRSTTIRYRLPADGNVQLDIVTIDGRLVENLFSGYQWQGENRVEWNAAGSKSGIYIYRLQYNNQSYFGKLVYNKY